MGQCYAFIFELCNVKNECVNFYIFEIENTGKLNKLVTNLSQIYHVFY